MYLLISPDQVQAVSQQQPQHSHNASMSEIDQTRIPTNFNLPDQMQQVGVINIFACQFETFFGTLQTTKLPLCFFS